MNLTTRLAIARAREATSTLPARDGGGLGPNDDREARRNRSMSPREDTRPEWLRRMTSKDLTGGAT